MRVSKKLPLRTGAIVDATLTSAPSSTKSSTKSRDQEILQTKKGNHQWYFGMKARIGLDVDSGLVHTVRGAAANVGDVVEANNLLHGQETERCGDAGYQGTDKRADAPKKIQWHIVMKRSKRKTLDTQQLIPALQEQLVQVESRIRANIERSFREIKRQFRHTKARTLSSCLPVCLDELVDSRNPLVGEQPVETYDRYLKSQDGRETQAF